MTDGAAQPLTADGPVQPCPADGGGPEDALARLTAEADQLRRALTSRTAIDQAQGMLMALTPCPAEDAWHLLVAVSQQTNTKLRDVAAALVATARGHPLPSPLSRALHQALRRARTPP
ncbi:ANTAR domain-containing protein [Streptomyces sp. ODS05-4]|uniref:ANTAR domain-containing protein n=1 Tax=Streptomyces sp. ODS05-4 TaxID=2944939 RepID=UPI00210D745A|nr:ANTAR domain-containing protein [Streptomyces sp. ODS05-4]